MMISHLLCDYLSTILLIYLIIIMMISPTMSLFDSYDASLISSQQSISIY